MADSQLASPLSRSLRRGLAWIDALRLAWGTRSLVAEVRQYVLETCAAAEAEELRSGRRAKLVLGVVAEYPLLGYIRLGYDWVGAYYNPLLLFDEVHYFQSTPSVRPVLDLGYPMHVHCARTAEEIAAVCRQRSVAILRAYDPRTAKLAVRAGRSLKIPVVASVHQG